MKRPGLMIAMLVGAALGIALAQSAEARPPPQAAGLVTQGKATQIGVIVTDGGYSVVPVKVDGGSLTLTRGMVIRVQCPAIACMGTSATTSCGGTSLAENAGELVAANTAKTWILPDDTPAFSLMNPSGGNTCPFFKVE